MNCGGRGIQNPSKPPFRSLQNHICSDTLTLSEDTNIILDLKALYLYDHYLLITTVHLLCCKLRRWQLKLQLMPELVCKYS